MIHTYVHVTRTIYYTLFMCSLLLICLLDIASVDTSHEFQKDECNVKLIYIVGNFHGVLDFVVFMVGLLVTKFSIFTLYITCPAQPGLYV